VLGSLLGLKLETLTRSFACLQQESSLPPEQRREQLVHRDRLERPIEVACGRGRGML